MEIQIKNRFDGNIIFKHNQNENTIRLTVEIAIQQNVYLQGANLRGANLRGADLQGANLRVKDPPLNSHIFISEILWREANTEQQKDFTARVRLETDQCWEFFIKLAHLKNVDEWAREILSRWEEYTNQISQVAKEGD